MEKLRRKPPKIEEPPHLEEVTFEPEPVGAASS
jgi:hypothetical protein